MPVEKLPRGKEAKGAQISSVLNRKKMRQPLSSRRSFAAALLCLAAPLGILASIAWSCLKALLWPLSSKSKSTKGIFSESLSSKTSLSTAFLGGLRFVLTAGTPGICMPIRLLGRYGSAERDRLRFLHGAPHAHTQAAWFSWLPTTITSNAPAITVVSK